ncbi:MAG TPA: type II toxin-antitoxin system HicA family toxin [Methanoculleus sp.]|nr:type II toxin-antitoxin system HicA family toxin [Methanoculleus sp.]
MKGSHHLFCHPEAKRRVTVPVHGRNLPAGTPSEILKQGLSARRSRTVHGLRSRAGKCTSYSRERAWGGKAADAGFLPKRS